MKINTLEKVLAKSITKQKGCELLAVTRPTLDAWLSRYQTYGVDGLLPQSRKKSGPAHNKTKKEIEDTVEMFARKYYTEGVESLRDALFAEAGITIHPVTIWRILKRRNVRYTDWFPSTRKRWKKQLYTHQHAGQELQMDCVYPYGYKQGKVIYTIIDDATRIAFTKLYTAANEENTILFLKEVLQRFPFIILKIRMDNGSCFKAHTVRRFLTEMGIEVRYNTAYCPEQNGKIERFHRTLKEKGLKYGASCNSSLEALSYRLTLFNQWYNYTKHHRGLGMGGLTPMQKLQELTCGYVK